MLNEVKILYFSKTFEILRIAQNERTFPFSGGSGIITR